MEYITLNEFKKLYPTIEKGLLEEGEEKMGVKFQVNEKSNHVQFNFKGIDYSLSTKFVSTSGIEENAKSIVLKRNSRKDIFNEIKKIIAGEEIAPKINLITMKLTQEEVNMIQSYRENKTLKQEISSEQKVEMTQVPSEDNKSESFEKTFKDSLV